MSNAPKIILSTVTGAMIGAVSLYYVLDYPPSPVEIALKAITELSARKEAEKAEMYRLSQQLMQKKVNKVQTQLSDAHEKRIIAEKRATQIEEESNKKIASVIKEAEMIRENFAVTMTSATKEEVPEIQETHINNLEVSNAKLISSLGSSKKTLRTEQAVSDALRKELDFSQMESHVFKSRYELAENRVKELGGRKFRWGPGVTFGGVKSLDGKWAIGAAVGITIGWN